MEKKKHSNDDERSKEGSINAEASHVNDSDDDGVLVATHEYKGENKWILDSGCSFHMTSNKDLFITYERIDGGNVTMGNNATCKVVGVGSIHIKMFDGMVRTLFDVKHVPGLKKNL